MKWRKAALLIMSSDEVSTDGSLAIQMLFEHAYEKYSQALYAYFFGRTAGTESAQDLLQVTFLRVWRHRQNLLELADEQQQAWMFAIARNLLIDYYRHRATQSAAEEEFAQFASPPSGTQNEVDIQVEKMQQVALLDLAIKRLPEELRTVLVLGTLAGMSSHEIGAVLGKPAGTIRYQMAKARKGLAEALQESDAWDQKFWTRMSTVLIHASTAVQSVPSKPWNLALSLQTDLKQIASWNSFDNPGYRPYLRLST